MNSKKKKIKKNRHSRTEYRNRLIYRHRLGKRIKYLHLVHMKRTSRNVTFCQKTLAAPSIDEIEKKPVLKYFSIKEVKKSLLQLNLE